MDELCRFLWTGRRGFAIGLHGKPHRSGGGFQEDHGGAAYSMRLLPRAFSQSGQGMGRSLPVAALMQEHRGRRGSTMQRAAHRVATIERRVAAARSGSVLI